MFQLRVLSMSRKLHIVCGPVFAAFKADTLIFKMISRRHKNPMFYREAMGHKPGESEPSVTSQRANSLNCFQKNEANRKHLRQTSLDPS